MKLSTYAKHLGISYSTAWRMWKRGEIAGYQLVSGTVIVNQPEEESHVTRKVAIYARVPNSENKQNLDTQAERLVAWCTMQGWSGAQVVKEYGSGVNDQRPRFLALLADPSITHIVVEHKDRASRFGVAYIQTLLAVQRRELVVVNSAQTADEEKKKRTRKKKSKQTITCAVPHIRLSEANPGKLDALDQLVVVYQALCQQYVTLWCTTDDIPDGYAPPVFASQLSDRWHRVAMQQAAGIAKSWRTNRQAAFDAYLEELADYAQAIAKAEESRISLDPKRKEPVWREWNVPELRVPCIQATANVVVLEPSEDSTFAYWLRISTLDKGHPLRVPVTFAAYHTQALTEKKLNTSTTLCKRNGCWWLTLSFDEDVALQTETDAPRVGVDVGIANFLTTSTGKQYGTFHGKLARRHKRDREKRRHKAKLRACLKKKGVAKLPSTSSVTGQRLSLHVRQEINRAVALMIQDHPEARIVYEELSVASMRFKARRMNAYLYASNLAHMPEQIKWATAKRGMAANTAKAAYSSQECSRCHYVERANRVSQQTFCCVYCGYQDHADRNASLNVASRWGDQELAACQNEGQIKALLLRRHEECTQLFGLAVVQPAVQLGLWDDPPTSTDVA